MHEPVVIEPTVTSSADAPTPPQRPPGFAIAAPIESQRLTLRPVAAADLPALAAINGDAEVTRFLPYATWQSADDGTAWLARMDAVAAAGTGQQLIIVRRADGMVIGTLLLFRFDAGSARVELGYVLGRSHRRQGLMREAVLAACGHVFGVLGLRRIEAEVNPANVASNRLLAGIGFTLEGTLRERWVTKGVAHDTHLYGCLAADWQRISKPG